MASGSNPHDDHSPSQPNAASGSGGGAYKDGSGRDTASARDTIVRQHARQRAVSMIAGPIWVGLSTLIMRFYFRYRIADVEEVRAQYRQLRTQSDTPMVICGNHLTLVDSFLMAWALGSGWYWLGHPDELPWNTPESKNFGRTRLSRFLIFIAKCIPITRGGAREGVGDVLERVKHLLLRGETAMLFPEAGRSRSGRVEEGSGAWGVGRIVGSVPGCRVLCIYLRGRRQETWGDFPAKGDVMDVRIACIEPKSDLRGVRRSRDIAQQVVRQLMRMEEDYFDARQ